MYIDMTVINVDLANLEFGANHAHTDLAPFFWLCLHDSWLAMLSDIGNPLFFRGLSVLLESTDFEGGPTDFYDITFPELPFRIVPTGLQLGIVTQYSQLDEEGRPYAAD